jgi:hypothetical protein
MTSKHIISSTIVLTTLLIFNTANAQQYYPFPSDTASWNCLFWHQWSPQDIYLFNSSYLLEGDTILNGVSYKKVYYSEPDNPNFIPEYIGGLRENDTREIYFFPFSQNLVSPGPISFPSDTSEHLLYSFNDLEAGMILPINTSFTEISVVGIDSVLLGENYRKRYKIQQQGLFDYDYWIEGIGSTKDLFIPFTYEFEWQYFTLCFTDSTTYYINSPNGQDSCHYWLPVGIDEINPAQEWFSPNPATSHITLSNPNTNIQLHNLQGQLILTSLPGEQQISLHGIKPGVYVVSVMERGELIGKEKIIKQ